MATVVKLRKGAVEQLLKGMERGFLSAHSFDVSFNGTDGTTLQVTYKDKPGFVFQILHPQSETNQSNGWRTVESPGRYFTSAETYDHPQFQGAYNAAFSWADRIVEEVLLEAKHHNDSTLLDDLRRNVEATADALPDPEKPFTTSELEDWSQQLKSLVTRLRELEQTNEIQQGRIENVFRQLEELKKQGTTVPKRMWLKTAGNKVLDLLDSTSKAALKSLAEGAVKAMLEHKP